MQAMKAVKGFKTSGIFSGIKKDASKKDLMLIYSEVPAAAAAVFTLNLAAAAPIGISKSRLAAGTHQAVIVNSGNANACTGDQGLRSAIETTEILAKSLNISPDSVLVASTGIIGVQLPMEPIRDRMADLIDSLEDPSSMNAPEAIMTTDTFPKTATREIMLGGKTITLSGFSKGSGMIHPNMATMLGFIMTDASIEKTLLQKALSDATILSFNQVSVDGDTSTNDCVIVLANGAAENPAITDIGPDYSVFSDALKALCIDLSKLIAKDGEGATKLLESRVTGAYDDKTAQILSKSVISSSLVKAAFFGNDANWGRIVCALGYAGVPADLSKASVTLMSDGGIIPVFTEGVGIVFDEDLALKVLKCDTVIIQIELKDGKGSGTAWGCDLTYDYVKINGDYRS